MYETWLISQALMNKKSLYRKIINFTALLQKWRGSFHGQKTSCFVLYSTSLLSHKIDGILSRMILPSFFRDKTNPLQQISSVLTLGPSNKAPLQHSSSTLKLRYTKTYPRIATFFSCCVRWSLLKIHFLCIKNFSFLFFVCLI